MLATSISPTSTTSAPYSGSKGLMPIAGYVTEELKNYADDAVFFTDDPTKWDYVFRNFEASADVVGLHTNWHKTKIQNIGTGDAPRTVHIDNQVVETVSRFTYLGSDIDSDGYSYPEIPYIDAWASLAPLWLNLTMSDNVYPL